VGGIAVVIPIVVNISLYRIVLANLLNFGIELFCLRAIPECEPKVIAYFAYSIE
jgi:hypothetical protein